MTLRRHWQVTTGILFWNNINIFTSTYIRVCAISANLAQNRLRLMHDVNLYMRLYGTYIDNTIKPLFSETCLQGNFYLAKPCCLQRTSLYGEDFTTRLYNKICYPGLVKISNPIKHVECQKQGRKHRGPITNDIYGTTPPPPLWV